MEHGDKDRTPPVKDDYTSLIRSLVFPFTFVFLLWLIELIQVIFSVRFIAFGIIPHRPEGLSGILTSPFIHAGSDHLLANTLPLLIAGTTLFYFYPSLAARVIMLVWILSGIWVWIAGRETSHIGASGLIYGLVFFLFFSGILRKDPRLIAISLLVTFLYGSLVWGIFPIDESMSWESHLFGSIAGIICSFYFRKEGPQRKKAQWEIDEELEKYIAENRTEDENSGEADTNAGVNMEENPSVQIKYHFREKGETKQDEK